MAMDLIEHPCDAESARRILFHLQSGREVVQGNDVGQERLLKAPSWAFLILKFQKKMKMVN